MARANLNLSPEISEAFLFAQESKTVRILTIKIRSENLELDSTYNRVGSVKEDFENLLGPTLIDNQATFILFCLAENAVEVPSIILFLISFP
jgi:hypothetical protein